MDQQALRRWEQRCTQEDPPRCQAACPIHVDVRAFMGHAQQGQWKQARAVLARTMPLPGVLGLICDHPCEARCRRGDLDESVRIGELERAAIRLHPERESIRPLPSKGVRVAVMGAGLAALTAAWDLGKKGYTPVVHAPKEEWGGQLLEYDADRLPPQALEDARQQLSGLRVEFVDIPALDESLLGQLREEFPAVMVGMDTPSLKAGLDSLSLSASEAITLQCGDGVFCAGGMEVDTFLPMTSVATGRRAANSVDRFLQKASLTASREKEGPYETALFTSIADNATASAISPAQSLGYTADEASQEAARCLNCQCLECVKVCDYLTQFKGYPKKYAREIYNNLSIVQGLRQANTLIDSCSGCGLCAQVCPQDFHMGEFCRMAREEMVTTGKMPASAFDFALRDFEMNVSEAVAMARHAPGEDSSEWLFLPGCQLAGSTPDMVQRVYAHLRESMSQDGQRVGLLLSCCGAPAKWAGQRERFTSHLDSLAATLQEMGSPRLILGCTTCANTFQEHLPGVEWASLWEVLHQYPPVQPGEASTLPTSLALHDPCTARHLGHVRQAVRALATQAGVVVQEPAMTGELTECCGYGGGMEAANPALADVVARHRVERLTKEEEAILAWCAMCRDSLSRSGVLVHHLLDALFPEAASPPSQADCSFIRRAPGFADRQTNRLRLKRALLQEVWRAPARADEDTLPLHVESAVQAVLDQRRILLSDIRAAIRHGLETGRVLVHGESGRRLVAHAPASVTYWVEYSVESTHVAAYRIHRAWSHRMTLSEA